MTLSKDLQEEGELGMLMSGQRTLHQRDQHVQRAWVGVRPPLWGSGREASWGLLGVRGRRRRGAGRWCVDAVMERWHSEQRGI